MNAAPTHHPDSELLLARAAGRLEPAFALVISAHLDLCPRCARRAAVLDTVGGVVLETTPPAELSRALLQKTLKRLDTPDGHPAGQDESPAAEGLFPLGLTPVPGSLRALTAAAAETRGWKKLPGGIRVFVLRKESSGMEVRYLLIPPGAGVPRHSHQGLELTLVVSGAFRDETGFYEKGDLATCTADLTHRPVAGLDGPCLALVVTSAPVRLTGALGMVQRVFGGADASV